MGEMLLMPTRRRRSRSQAGDCAPVLTPRITRDAKIGHAAGASRVTGNAAVLRAATAQLVAHEHPGARVHVFGNAGLAAELTAIGGGLERLGVHAEFIRRGDYKTAPELFTRETVSEIQRESIDRFLDERYREAVSVIASGRRVTEEKVRVWIDQGPYSARRAQREPAARREHRQVVGIVVEPAARAERERAGFEMLDREREQPTTRHQRR